VLSDYTGSCTITVSNTVIDSKRVNCFLDVRAPGLVIRNSLLIGGIGTSGGSGSFTLTDSTVNGGTSSVQAAGGESYTITRSNIYGARISVFCEHDCVVRDSWLHGQYLAPGASWHVDGFMTNGGPNITLDHNSITCDVTPNSADGGCSGAVNLFPDFAPVTNVSVTNNLIVAAPGMSYCFYGTGDKPYSSSSGNVVVTGNVFQRGVTGKCAAYGPVSSWSATQAGNQWTNNRWDSGELVSP
jgi:hypothetical protein